MASANAWQKYLTHIPPFTVVKIVVYKKKVENQKELPEVIITLLGITFTMYL